MRLGGSHFGFGLQAAVAANVRHRHTAFAQHAPHQQPAMASGGILFGAQRGHYLSPQAIFQALHAFLKFRRRGGFAVEHAPIGIAISIAARPSAQFRAEIRILKSRLAQGFL